jgi:hypothetical protein
MAVPVSDLPPRAEVAKQRYLKPDHAIAEYDGDFKEGSAVVA